MNDTSLDYMIGRPRVGYNLFQTDSEGNILIFKKTDCVSDCPILIQVYSPEGNFLSETELVEGSFGLNISSNWTTISFSDTYLYALVEVKDAPEYSLRLIKVMLVPF